MYRGLQIAKARGYRVIGIDSGDKLGLCMTCGADDFIDFKKQDVSYTHSEQGGT